MSPIESKMQPCVRYFPAFGIVPARGSRYAPARKTGDYPRGFQVNVSHDGTNWGGPVATGTGSSTVTSISFAARTARNIRITQTGTNGLWWSIHELNVYGSGPPPPPAGVVEKLGEGQVTLSWNAAAGAVSYNVKRSTSYGGPYPVLVSNLVGLTYTDTTAVSGTLYFYVVSANDAYGESPNSSQARLGGSSCCRDIPRSFVDG